MTRMRTRFVTLAVVVATVLAMIAPAAAGVAAEAGDLAVTTDGATDVTETTATLNGNLTGLGNATNASVSFAYWAKGDADTASEADAGTANATGAFQASVDGLEPNTTYVAVARADGSDGSAATGEEITFETDDAFDVRTDSAADVTNSSATLRGELVDLDGAANATVWFEYRLQGGENATTVGERTLNETGTFETTIDDLAENETYVYVAYAEPADGEAEAGGEVTFETAVEAWEDEDRPFGQRVSAYVHGLFGVTLDGPFGAYVSEWVVANNPGADNRPDYAGSDGDRERGPPDHAKGDRDEEDDEHDDGDRERGPPDHATDDNGDDDDDEDDERGNGKARGNGNANSYGASPN